MRAVLSYPPPRRVNLHVSPVVLRMGVSIDMMRWVNHKFADGLVRLDFAECEEVVSIGEVKRIMIQRRNDRQTGRGTSMSMAYLTARCDTKPLISVRNFK